MSFKSILFQDVETSIEKKVLEEPDYFRDLNLDKVVDSITAGMKEYNLKQLLFTPLHSVDQIRYRQEIMHDLEENEALFKIIKKFSKKIYEVAHSMKKVLENLEQKDIYYNNYLEKGILFKSVNVYCEAINTLVNDLASHDLKSKGLSEFRTFISNYSKSNAFISLLSETNALKSDLSTVKYCMLIKDNCIKVRKYENETDYTVEIEKIFQKFKQGDVKDYRKKLFEEPYAQHVEAGVLNMVAKMYPEIFSKLDSYCTKNKYFINETISKFSQEIQFYIAYLLYINKFKQAGLHFCYPQIVKQNKEIYNYEGFDLALADKLIGENKPIVCNDFYLKGKERIIVVSGPNQGGKTTFSRVFGQLHHLASLGYPVPGRRAQLFLSDKIFTHFEKEEDVKNLNGKLQDDLIRMHNILGQATTESIVIINEFLSSAALKDAVLIGKSIMNKLVELDSLCVCVTFLDEIASYSDKNVSMVSTVFPEDPVKRTYKIIRSPADGLAYALHIAEKYGLNYTSLKERIKA